MQDFIDFGLRHWELCLAFVLILIYWLISEYLEYRSNHGLAPTQLIHLMNREQAVVIDLREANLFEEGHILGAKSFPEQNFLKDNTLNKLKKYQSKPVILVDSNGSVSARLLNQVITKGFTRTAYLKQGMQSWIHSKLPLEKGKSPHEN